MSSSSTMDSHFVSSYDKNSTQNFFIKTFGVFPVGDSECTPFAEPTFEQAI
jgi:hypothetical protein